MSGRPPLNGRELPRCVTEWVLPHACTVASTVRTRTGPETASDGTTTLISVDVAEATGAVTVATSLGKTTTVSRPGLKFVPWIVMTSPAHASLGSSRVMS